MSVFRFGVLGAWILWGSAATGQGLQDILQAEPQEPTGQFTTALEVKPILSATRSNWVAVREWELQDYVYVTHIWAWRCGLVQLEVSVNSGPFEIWPLPECHLDTSTPNAILEQDGLPYRTYAPNAVIEIAVRVTYDDLTTETARFPRSAILLP
ncbi:MAG: hypothetical protein ABJQ34_15600 [Paracoccaceae bacterium]